MRRCGRRRRWIKRIMIEENGVQPLCGVAYETKPGNSIVLVMYNVITFYIKVNLITRSLGRSWLHRVAFPNSRRPRQGVGERLGAPRRALHPLSGLPLMAERTLIRIQRKSRAMRTGGRWGGGRRGARACICMYRYGASSGRRRESQ
jgi:hypothetical protein